MKAPALLPPMIEPKSAPPAETPRVQGRRPLVADEAYDTRMRQAIVDRVIRPVQAKPAVDFGYGDLVAAARALPPTQAAVQRTRDAQRGDELEEEAGQVEEEGAAIRTKRASPAGAEVPADVGSPVRAAVQGGEPLPGAVRSYFEPRFGHDFGGVRVHAGGQAAEAARSVAADAFTLGEHVVFGAGQYAPETAAGRHLLAHELTHVVQQRAGARALQRRAANCPASPPSPPTINTMDDFIALVQRVEASTPAGNDPIATARLISRTKYDGRAWDWLLPSTRGAPGAVASGTVTANDIGSLCFKLIVSLPGGGMEDPMHVIAAIVADAETSPAGQGATGLSRLVDPLPASVSQRGTSTWVGDVGKAAAGWMSEALKTKAEYMAEDAPPHDLRADVDGVAMTSRSAASGFAFDRTKPLSDNLQRFFHPATGTGRERRFHVFCAAEGFTLQASGVTLSAAAKATIGQRIHDFAVWFMDNDPDLALSGIAAIVGGSAEEAGQILRRNDWQWFADRFVEFVETNLAAEGP